MRARTKSYMVRRNRDRAKDLHTQYRTLTHPRTHAPTHPRARAHTFTVTHTHEHTREHARIHTHTQAHTHTHAVVAAATLHVSNVARFWDCHICGAHLHVRLLAH
jgi:hypothetical protein